MTNLRQRDFESKDFELTCSRETCIVDFVNDSVAVLSPRKQFKGNKDGNEDKATTYLKDHPDLTARDAVAGLAALGIKRGKTWVQKKQAELFLSSGGKMRGQKE